MVERKRNQDLSDTDNKRKRRKEKHGEEEKKESHQAVLNITSPHA